MLPLLFMLLFGIMQFGQVLYAYSFVAYAAQTATRYATIHSSTSSQPATSTSVTSYVKAIAYGIDATKLTVTSTWTPNAAPGSSVKVKVAYTYVPFAPFLTSANISLSSTTQNTILH